MTNINTMICVMFVLLFATQTFAQSNAQETHGLQTAVIEPGTIFLDGYETCVCEDELTCTLDICLNDGSCGIIISGGSCLIDDTCYVDGDFKPGDEWYSCQPGIDRNKWTMNCAVDGAACNAGDASCSYGDTICDCNGFTNTWQCFTCPQNQPSSGDACTDTGASCNYDNINCFCSPQTNAWICF